MNSKWMPWLLAAILLPVALAVTLPRAQEVPNPPVESDISNEEQKVWEELDFEEAIPPEWGPLVSINRAERGGECYTFWFMDQGGTLRGITTRSFTGSMRGTFFPQVYTIKRGPGPKTIPAQTTPEPSRDLERLPDIAPEEKDKAAPADTPPPARRP